VRPRETCTVAALRAEASDVDTSLVSRATGRSPGAVKGLVDLASAAQALIADD